jgi:uncharacterized protein YndB with AHSA1/START domain
MDDLSITIPERDIVSPRFLKATSEAAFAAFADPERLARWWGPKGFTNTMQAFELRPGGRWHILMHAPDGQNFPNRSTFVEVIPGRRVVYDHGDHVFLAMLDFAPEGDGTRLTFVQRFPTAAERDAVAPICIPGNEENLDRLEAELAQTLKR